MFDTTESDGLFQVPNALDALQQLSQNTSEAVVAQRSSTRLEIRTSLTIQPANSNERDRFEIQGLTADVSNGGCCALTARPILPGDVVWLTFSDEQISIGSLFARCLRCRLVREDTFEVGFRFLKDVDLALLQ